MACDNIQKMRADMGGTNILSPLKWVIRQPALRGYPRLLFLITDGAVNNTGKVLELVRNHAFSTRWAQAEGLGLGFPGLPWAEDARPGVTWKMPEGKARTHNSSRALLPGWCPVQFSSVAQSYLTLCDPMDCSTPGLPVHRQLPEFIQTYVH